MTTPTERALLDELLKLRDEYERGAETLRQMYEQTSAENQKISQHLTELSSQLASFVLLVNGRGPQR